MKKLLTKRKANETLNAIHAVLNGKIWDADTPCDIATILENAGYTIAGVDDDEGSDGNN